MTNQKLNQRRHHGGKKIFYQPNNGASVRSSVKGLGDMSEKGPRETCWNTESSRDSGQLEVLSGSMKGKYNGLYLSPCLHNVLGSV